MIDIVSILQEVKRPSPYQPGAQLWTHPHISSEMLQEHLSPNNDAASYKPATIEAICDSLPARMGLANGACIIDLGCGPGLYCQRLATHGFHMTGVDLSENSIRYAKEHAAEMTSRFECASYLEPLRYAEQDGAIMISEDYGVLSPIQRKSFLQNVRSVLKPGGVFAFDVSGYAAFQEIQKTTHMNWSAAEKGFWRPHPYLVLEDIFLYPEMTCSCNLYAVLDDTLTMYRIWQTYFTPDSIRIELEQNGFTVIETLASLSGGDWKEESKTIGVICRKVG